MKKISVFAIIGMAAVLTACGSGSASTETATTEVVTSEDTAAVEATDAASTEATKAAATDISTEDTASTDTAGSGISVGADDDNFTVDPATVTAFAKEVQTAVAAKDMDALSDLMIYPTYVSDVEENDGIINTKEDFLAIDPDLIFTDALMNAVANTDFDSFVACEAGFTFAVDDDYTNSITFGVEGGQIGIQGITVTQ